MDHEKIIFGGFYIIGNNNSGMRVERVECSGKLVGIVGKHVCWIIDADGF